LTDHRLCAFPYHACRYRRGGLTWCSMRALCLSWHRAGSLFGQQIGAGSFPPRCSRSALFSTWCSA